MVRFLSPVILALALLPAIAHANKVHAPSFREVLRLAGGDPGVPAEWEGVWQYEDTTRTCDSTAINSTDSGLDTLCVGGSFDPDTSTSFQCSGTSTSTDFDLTCTGSFTFSGCTATFTFHTQGTRTGETAHYVQTFTTTYEPPLCAFTPNSCEVTTGSRTRINSAPKTCATPTKRSTWGKVKVLYR